MSVRSLMFSVTLLCRFKYNTETEIYQVVIGGWSNERSTIIDCNQCAVAWSVNNSPLSDVESRSFWVTWHLNSTSDADNYGLTIRSGTGNTVLQNEFMAWYDPQPHDINYVGISTGWGTNGTWTFNIGNKALILLLPKHLCYVSSIVQIHQQYHMARASIPVSLSSPHHWIWKFG